MQHIEVNKITFTVTFQNKSYRVQNDRGHRHIIVRIDGKRTKITIKEKKKYQYNVFFHYVLEGLQQTFPCRVQEWWLEMYLAKKYLPLK